MWPWMNIFMLDLDTLRLHLLNGFLLTTPNDSEARDACCQALAQVIVEDEQLRAEVERLRAELSHIANRDDAEMAHARTLYYDMRGWARAVLSPDRDDARTERSAD
jgi:hypothetical protein